MDDSLAFQSSPAGLAAANRALTRFCRDWKHWFQGGRKRPAVMAVPPAVRAEGMCGEVCGAEPMHTETLDMLGVPVDAALDFGALLTKVCTRLREGSRKLMAALSQKGFFIT